MIVDIAYFAWVRERMGLAAERVTLPPAVVTVGDLVRWLAARDERGARAFAEPQRIRAAVDGEMTAPDALIGGAGEIALFPPVTGG